MATADDRREADYPGGPLRLELLFFRHIQALGQHPADLGVAHLLLQAEQRVGRRLVVGRALFEGSAPATGLAWMRSAGWVLAMARLLRASTSNAGATAAAAGKLAGWRNDR